MEGSKVYVTRYISIHSTRCSCLFLSFLKLLIFEMGDVIFSREPIMQNVGIIWSPLLYFKNFKDPNSALLIRLQCILPDPAVLWLLGGRSPLPISSPVRQFDPKPINNWLLPANQQYMSKWSQEMIKSGGHCGHPIIPNFLLKQRLKTKNGV